VQRGGLGKAYQVFGKDLEPILKELNEVGTSKKTLMEPHSVDALPYRLNGGNGEIR
jgi:hypothetical protein